MTGASKAPRTERAVDTALALATLVTAAGALLIATGLLVNVRASVPALGLILFILGVALGIEFGIRPALRQERSPLDGARNGLRRLASWLRRMVGGR